MASCHAQCTWSWLHELGRCFCRIKTCLPLYGRHSSSTWTWSYCICICVFVFVLCICICFVYLYIIYRIKTCLPRLSLIFHVDIIFYKNWFKSKTKTQTAYIWSTSCSYGSCCGLLQGWMEMFLFYSSVISFPLDSWNCWGMGMTQKCTLVHTQRPGSDADDIAAVLIWHRYDDNDIESVHLFTLKDQMRQIILKI